ncbi:MAG: molybdopterin cofactor-binding domain-containing protein [Burkholderiales bacterium]|nr:molybdopterin cofactor-binding domain-containing protein [Burkholderiales bacterium]
MIRLRVNGAERRVEADPAKPLLWVLRDELGLTGTKYGCGVGVCGACLVLLDGEPSHACMVPLAKVGAREVTTIEGLGAGHPVVRAWIAEQVPQCGYCQPAQILAASALLARSPAPTQAEIDAAMSGVYCRCGTYARIRRAIARAARGAQAPAAERLPELLSELPADAGVALNEWLWIDAAGTVTLMVNYAEMGQGALTGLAVLAAEELEVPLARLRTVFAPPARRYWNAYWGGGQFTGGSSSIRGEWKRLRRAAARARARLVAAAAAHWGVPASECRADGGFVVHAPSGARLGYGELAEAAAAIGSPRAVRLKRAAEWRLIGKPLARLDIPAMCLGATGYGIDVARPGMRVAVVARPPVPGARLEGFDAQRALAVPGVRQVLAISAGVAVVADDFWSAERGRAALSVRWREGPSARLDDAAIERRLLSALARPGRVVRERGDARPRLRRAVRVVEAVYRTPYLAHATIEPMNCVADVRRDACDVWVGTQSQTDTQQAAARAAGLAPSQVRVHTRFLGGGFGRRLETDFVVEAVEISKAIGAPVKVVWTRADDLRHDFYRPAHAIRLRAALGADGLPEAWEMRIAGPEPALEGIDVPYAVPALREEHVSVDSPLRVGYWRGVGATNNAFAIESFVDELARCARRDPLEYRLALLAKAPRHRAVLELAADRAGWRSRCAPGTGRGIAVYASFGSVVAQVVEASVARGAIRVARVVCAMDCGTAVLPDAVHAQLEGGIAFGLSAALKEEVRVRRGRVAHSSLSDYPILAFGDMPEVETHLVPSEGEPGGVGEPAVPVVAPAAANAVFAATGRRLRRLPLRLRARPARG